VILHGWRQWLMAFAFLLAVTVTALFAVRAIHRGAPHRHEEPLRGWMTIPYIAHSYRVPPHVLYEALELPSGKPHDKRPIREIARAQGRSVDEVKIILMNAIIHSRPPSQPAPPPSPPNEDGGRKR
jgi:hypothetical protein